MSKFEIRVTQKAVLKGDTDQIRKEFYDTWAIADTVYCLYRDLIKIQGSGIIEAEFIEHRHEVLHKSAKRALQNGEFIEFVQEAA
jgi:hypothetical protein